MEEETQTRPHVQAHACGHTCMCTYTHACAHAHIHTHTEMHRHRDMHTYTYGHTCTLPAMAQDPGPSGRTSEQTDLMQA